MKKTSLVFLAITFILSCSAQPGYMGRRLLITPEIGYSWNLYNTQQSSSLFSFIAEYGVGAGYVLSNRIQLNLLASTYTMKGMYSKKDTLSGKYDGFYSDKLTAYEFQFSGRYYLKTIFKKTTGSIAPVGKFFEFGPVLTFANYTPGADSYYDDFYTRNFLPVVYAPANRTLLHFVIGFGTQHIYWDRLVIYSGLMIASPVIDINKEEVTSQANDYLRAMTLRNVIRMRFGIGIII